MSNTTTFREKLKTACGKLGNFCSKTGSVLGKIGLLIYRQRKLLMAVPVVYGAVRLASMNMEKLPEAVGLNLQSNGEFALLVTREYAVYGPLLVTAFCLLLMFCSRKAWYPWIISIFSLVLPLLLWFTNVFPG